MNIETRLSDLWSRTKGWVKTQFVSSLKRKSELAPLTQEEQKDSHRLVLWIVGLLTGICLVGGHVMMTGLGLAIAPIVLLEIVRASSGELGEMIGCLVTRYRNRIMAVTTIGVIVMGFASGSVVAFATWSVLDLVKSIYIGGYFPMVFVKGSQRATA